MTFRRVNLEKKIPPEVIVTFIIDRFFPCHRPVETAGHGIGRLDEISVCYSDVNFSCSIRRTPCGMARLCAGVWKGMEGPNTV